MVWFICYFRIKNTNILHQKKDKNHSMLLIETETGFNRLKKSKYQKTNGKTQSQMSMKLETKLNK